MRVICLVPSLTETLLEAGVQVVGRTRYCIHPESLVPSIPAIGGTKDLNWDRFMELKPDLLILDREENLPFMKEMDEVPLAQRPQVLVSHVVSLHSMASLAGDLIALFPGNVFFHRFLERWLKVIEAPPAVWDWKRIPGAETQWNTKEKSHLGATDEPSPQPEELLYLIWRKPWMAVSTETFIADVIAKLGGGAYLKFIETAYPEKKYPQLSESDFTRPHSFSLFSSEPYPFRKYGEELKKWAPRGALVDGESYSWFGIRSLRFLEAQLFQK